MDYKGTLKVYSGLKELEGTPLVHADSVFVESTTTGYKSLGTKLDEIDGEISAIETAANSVPAATAADAGKFLMVNSRGQLYYSGINFYDGTVTVS